MVSHLATGVNIQASGAYHRLRLRAWRWPSPWRCGLWPMAISSADKPMGEPLVSPTTGSGRKGNGPKHYFNILDTISEENCKSFLRIAWPPPPARSFLAIVYFAPSVGCRQDLAVGGAL